MLTCITCSKQTIEDGGDEAAAAPRGTPSTRDAVKSLTTQIKDMALKVSGKGKPNEAEGSYKKGQRSYPDFDTISEGVPYPYVQGAGSTSSTPAWDFTRTGHRPDQTPGGGASVSSQVVVEDEDEAKEWTAQVEPGVMITFVSLPRGGNDLKRIRFSREMFNKWQAQRWWGENYDRIMELYNVQRFNQQAMNTPGRSEDGRDSTYSRMGSAMESPAMTPSMKYKDNFQGGGSSGGAQKGEMSSVEASRTTTSSSRDVSVSNASDIESEWIEEDEPGVYITIRQLLDGTRELDVSDSAVKSLERCMPSIGGKLTGTGYKLNIFASTHFSMEGIRGFILTITINAEDTWKSIFSNRKSFDLLIRRGVIVSGRAFFFIPQFVLASSNMLFIHSCIKAIHIHIHHLSLSLSSSH